MIARLTDLPSARRRRPKDGRALSAVSRERARLLLGRAGAALTDHAVDALRVALLAIARRAVSEANKEVSVER